MMLRVLIPVLIGCGLAVVDPGGREVAGFVDGQRPKLVAEVVAEQDALGDIDDAFGFQIVLQDDLGIDFVGGASGVGRVEGEVAVRGSAGAVTEGYVGFGVGAVCADFEVVTLDFDITSDGEIALDQQVAFDDFGELGLSGAVAGNGTGRGRENRDDGDGDSDFETPHITEYRAGRSGVASENGRG